ncbi:hypothetical protein ACFSVJ_03750 [Prauserella oleivorans]
MSMSTKDARERGQRNRRPVRRWGSPLSLRCNNSTRCARRA